MELQNLLDYILAYQEQVDKPREWQEKRADKRKKFQENLEAQGLELEQEDFEVGLAILLPAPNIRQLGTYIVYPWM